MVSIYIKLLSLKKGISMARITGEIRVTKGDNELLFVQVSQVLLYPCLTFLSPSLPFSPFFLVPRRVLPHVTAKQSRGVCFRPELSLWIKELLKGE